MVQATSLTGVLEILMVEKWHLAIDLTYSGPRLEKRKLYIRADLLMYIDSFLYADSLRPIWLKFHWFEAHWEEVWGVQGA